MTNRRSRRSSRGAKVTPVLILAVTAATAQAQVTIHGATRPAWLPPPPVDAKIALMTVAIPMRDGVQLAGSVWLPDGAGPFPVVVSRTAYDREIYAGSAEAMNERGAAYVSVDVRGRFDSGGVWEPLALEGRDGQDVLAWVDEQDWCNGRIGTFGGSYDAWIQMLAASRGSPELDAMAVIVLPADPWENAPFDNGACSAPFITWVVQNRQRLPEPFPSGVDFIDVIATYPLDQWDDLMGRSAPFFDDWLHNWVHDGYWAARSYESGIGGIRAPALLHSGWFDLNHPGSIRTFQALVNHPSPRVRMGTKLIVGPWHHGLGYLAEHGELQFPDNARLENIGDIWFDWLSDQLQGPGVRTGPAVEYYLMGRNDWLAGDDWPPRNSRQVELYLAPNGELSRTPPMEATDVFVYDPNDPTPIVEPLSEHDLGAVMGHYPHDLSQLAQRSDVLLYATEPLQSPFAVVGPVSAVVHLSSSAADTDIGAQLVDLTPDGRAIAIQHGLSRARFRDGYGDPKPLDAGEPAPIEVDLWSTAYEFATGHRIGVVISSAQFPSFDAHRNLYDDLASGTELQVATQTIHLGGSHPSRLVVHQLVDSVRGSAGRRVGPTIP